MTSPFSLLRRGPVLLRSAVDGMPRSPSWTSTCRHHYPSSARIIASSPGPPLQLSSFTSSSSPTHQQQTRKSSNMSSQAPHPTLLIPGPIEFDDAVLQSMSHYRCVCVVCPAAGYAAAAAAAAAAMHALCRQLALHTRGDGSQQHQVPSERKKDEIANLMY